MSKNKQMLSDWSLHRHVLGVHLVSIGRFLVFMDSAHSPKLQIISNGFERKEPECTTCTFLASSKHVLQLAIPDLFQVKNQKLFHKL